MFENLRKSKQARIFATNVPKILDLKSSSEQIFSENLRWVPLLCGKVINLVLSLSYEFQSLDETLELLYCGVQGQRF